MLNALGARISSIGRGGGERERGREIVRCHQETTESRICGLNAVDGC